LPLRQPKLKQALVPLVLPPRKKRMTLSQSSWIGSKQAMSKHSQKKTRKKKARK